MINFEIQPASAAPVTWTKHLIQVPFGEQLNLTWSVADQVDVAGYELERAIGEGAFEKVADIPYKENGSLEVAYSVLTPWIERSAYYRIKQLDYAGTFDYSNTIFVGGNDNLTEQFKMFPNPASNMVRMSVPAGIHTVDLIGASGQVLRSLTADEVRREGLDVSSVPADLYVVRPVGQEDIARPQRLVVNH